MLNAFLDHDHNLTRTGVVLIYHTVMPSSDILRLTYVS